MNTFAAISVITGLISSMVILIDLVRHPQSMKIMNAVWVLTAMWSGVIGLFAYFWFGRQQQPKTTISTGKTMGMVMSQDKPMDMHMNDSKPMPEINMSTGKTMSMNESKFMPTMNMPTEKSMSMDMHDAKTMPAMEVPTGKTMSMHIHDSKSMSEMNMPTEKSMSMEIKNANEMFAMNMPMRPRWQSVTISTLHCGAGCTLADIIGEWFLYFVIITIAGSTFIGSMAIDYILALCIGVYFQYAAIRSMSGSMSTGKILGRAFRADVLSLTAWQIGMYGFMAVAFFVLFPSDTLHRTSWMFWFMMQIAMMFGFIVALPANVALIKWGIKKAM